MTATDDTPREQAEQQMTEASGARRRASLITVDQAMSSASNLGALLLAAHLLSPLNFGRFTLIFLVAMVAQGIVRATVSLPITVHPEDADNRQRDVLGSALTLGSIAGVLTVAVGGIGLLRDSELGWPLIVAGACLPLLQVHDVGRYLGFARATPVRSIILDSVWNLIMIGAVIAAVVTDHMNLPMLIGCWFGSGAVAALVALILYGVPRGLRLDWLRSRWSFSWRSLAANATSNGAALVGSSLMSLVATPVAVGAVRAALLLSRPAEAIQAAASTSTAADVARHQPDLRGLMAYQRRALLIGMGAAVINLGIVLALPDWAGRAALGRMWPVIEPLLLAVGLQLAGMAAVCGVRAVLLGRREISLTMRLDIATVVISMTSMVIGAAIGGASGAVWGLVCGQWCAVALAWTVFARYLRRPTAAHSAL